MKHAYRTHAEIATEFVNYKSEPGKLDTGRKYCRNASTSGGAYWSYSTNIAVKCETAAGPVIVLDSWRYSNTTARQADEIRRKATRANIPVIVCPYIFAPLNNSEKGHCENVDYFIERLDYFTDKLNRARKESWREVYRRYISEIEQARENYRIYFGI